MRRYTICLTEKQYKTVEHALETWQRMMMGQFNDYANDLAVIGYTNDKSDPENTEQFDDYIKRRNACQLVMDNAYQVGLKKGFLTEKTEDMLVIEDIWTAMRYKAWESAPGIKRFDTVESRRPLGLSDEPLPDIRVLG